MLTIIGIVLVVELALIINKLSVISDRLPKTTSEKREIALERLKKRLDNFEISPETYAEYVQEVLFAGPEKFKKIE